MASLSNGNCVEVVRAEDFVEYFIYPPIIENLNESEQETVLTSFLQKTNQVLCKYTSEYLWHKDPFKLVIRTSSTNVLTQIEGEKEFLPPHLYGITHYGDNIEDEWFIVHLLQQLTKQINGLIARVHDIDGEFLLIEAANSLPNWATPETCANRVYFYEGNLHIVPVEHDFLVDSESITVGEALSLIREDPNETVASVSIQKCIADKLGGYPEKIKANLHTASVFLPVGVAAILKHKPSLIAPAVNSFCNRDPIDLKACKAMKYFPPEERVYTNVTFTKCLYAMVLHSKYLPERNIGWDLPPMNDSKYKSHSLGVKIASGFEILVSQAKPSQSLDEDKNWHKFLKSLRENNYFNNLLEHSQDYNILLKKAKEFYINHRDSMHYAPSIGQEILELTKSLEYNIEDFKYLENNLPKEDDDSWLDISSDDLDKMLQEKYGNKKLVTVNSNSDATSFSEKITTFLNHVSDFEGAEFPDQDLPPVRPPRGIRKGKGNVSFAANNESEKGSETMKSNKIHFDPDQFTSAVQNILDFVIPDDDGWDLESDSGMSDYEEDSCVKESNLDARNKMEEYMKQMDAELAKTTIGESFEKKNGDNFEDIENFEPVDIDVNALKNILESYRSQMGEAGPSSNMLGPMGIHLDAEKSD